MPTAALALDDRPAYAEAVLSFSDYRPGDHLRVQDAMCARPIEGQWVGPTPYGHVLLDVGGVEHLVDWRLVDHIERIEKPMNE